MTIAWDMGTDLGTNVFVDTDNADDPIEFADTLEPWGFAVEFAAAPLSLASYETTEISYDKHLKTIWPVHIRSNKQATVTAAGAVNPVYASSNTAVATIDRNGYVRQVGNGTVTLSATCRGKVRSEAFTLAGFPESATGPNPQWEFRVLDSTPGWVRENLSDAVDDRLTDGSDMALFSGSYTRTTTSWLAGIDLTCHSPYNSTSGDAKRAGVLITPKHVIAANHYPIGVGATVRFVAMDNTVVDRTVASRTHVTGSDLMIHVLSEDVPAGITPCKVLPAAWANYLPARHVSLPCVHIDKQSDAGVVDLWNLVGDNEGVTVIDFGVRYDDTRKLYTSTKEAGDSGSPLFFIIDGELVFVTLVTNPLMGPATHEHFDAINAILAPLSLTPIDLSAYETVA